MSYPYGQQGGYGAPPGGGYGAPPGGQPGYGAPPGGGYGAPPGGQPGYGAPGGYGAPPGGQPGYGAPGGYGAPPGGGYGAPPGGQPGYGAPPGGGYGAPPGGQPGYGSPHAGAPGGAPGGYGAPPGGQPGYGAPPGGQPGYGSPGAAPGGAPGAPGGVHGSAYMHQSFRPTQQQMQGMGGSYYGQLQPHEIAELRGWFASVDKDRSGTITASELSEMTFAGKKFSLGTAKMLLNVFDTDKSGNIGFFEYCALHKFITGMQTAFFTHDRDGSGKLDMREVTESLAQGGFRFSQATVEAVFKRFEKKTFAARNDGLDFETFIQMCAYLGQVKSTFEVQDTDKDGWIRINLENLVMLSCSMPTTQV